MTGHVGVQQIEGAHFFRIHHGHFFIDADAIVLKGHFQIIHRLFDDDMQGAAMGKMGRIICYGIKCFVDQLQLRRSQAVCEIGGEIM